MDIGVIADKIAETLRSEANVRAVFGEPMKIDTKTVIPVAIVVAAVGGGAGESRLGSGAGGGLDVRALPFGFIHEEDGHVRFTEIDVARALDKPQHSSTRGTLAGVIERVQEITSTHNGRPRRAT